jgi:hypothetical protein
MKLKLAIITAALVGAACDNQATADLAVCKSDLAKTQADIATTKAAGEAKVAALEAQLKQVKDDAEKAAEEAKKAIEAEAKTAAADTKAAVKKAVVETTAKKADVKVTEPVKNMNTADKAKAAGF